MIHNAWKEQSINKLNTIVLWRDEFECISNQPAVHIYIKPDDRLKSGTIAF